MSLSSYGISRVLKKKNKKPERIGNDCIQTFPKLTHTDIKLEVQETQSLGRVNQEESKGCRDQ